MADDAPPTLGDATLVGDSQAAGGRHVELRRGDVIGRFVVVSKLGAGAMGVVYAAYDPELDRKVALKLLHPSTRGGQDDRVRLLREAQALARLSHPNIVAVHDVGTMGDDVWIAMEFVAGRTLREWLALRPRSWRDVLAVVTAAARGLEAAHDAGLVHRDFKPDNVMVGDERGSTGGFGRVCVMDFGLARRADGTDATLASPGMPEVARSGPESREDDSRSPQLTRTGAVLGTPAYMAAEQLGGRQADVRTDQFAFCVTTWEALFGERPFAGNALGELAAELLAGRIRVPASAARAPGWLRRVVQRGLACDPATRWPSMTELLDALERGRARVRTRRVVASITALGLAGTVAAVVYRVDARERVSVCEHAGGTVADVWNDEARARMHGALLATGLSYAETTAQHAMPWLDRQALELRDARTEACLDRHARGVWDEAMLDRSLWCLDQRVMELDALVEVLSGGDANAVRAAVTRAAGLASVEECRDASWLERQPSPPTERRDDIRGLGLQLTRAQALGLAGRPGEGLDAVRSLRADVEALGDVPLVLSARSTEASLLADSGEYERAAEVGGLVYFEAASAGAWDVAAKAASQLAFVVGYELARYDDGLEWGRHAAVALAHADDREGLLEAARLGNLALVHYATGEHDQARALHERALEIRESVLGPDHPAVADTLVNLAGLSYASGDYAQARVLQERALAVFEAALGPDHPAIAACLGNLAHLHVETGDPGRARALQERAVAIFEAALGPDHPDVAAALAGLAHALAKSGDVARARALQERALAIRERSLGREHPVVAMNLVDLADLSTERGDDNEAARLLERAVAIYDRHDGEQSAELDARFALAQALAATGRDRARARALALQARDGWKAAGAGRASAVAEVEQWLDTHDQHR